MDESLGSANRLSAAYCFLQEPKRSSFMEAAIADAMQYAEGVATPETLGRAGAPGSWTWRHSAVLMLAGVLFWAALAIDAPRASDLDGSQSAVAQSSWEELEEQRDPEPLPRAEDPIRPKPGLAQKNAQAGAMTNTMGASADLDDQPKKTRAHRVGGSSGGATFASD